MNGYYPYSEFVDDEFICAKNVSLIKYWKWPVITVVVDWEQISLCEKYINTLAGLVCHFIFFVANTGIWTITKRALYMSGKPAAVMTPTYW